MRQLAEIALAQAQQHGTVHLGVAADPVMDARLKRVAVLVVPSLASLVAVVSEHRLGAPVFPLARQIVAAFEDQDALARWSEPVSKRAAAGAAADDDHVITFSGHGKPPGTARRRNRNRKCNAGWCRGKAWRTASGGRDADAALPRGACREAVQSDKSRCRAR